MMKYANLVKEHIEELAALDAIDAKKVFAYGKARDVPSGARELRYYVGASDKIHGKTLRMANQLQGHTLNEPIGCTMVVKHAEQSPLFALYYAHLSKLGVSLELGDKCPLIIFDDVDVDSTVKLALMGSFTNKGEFCMCRSQIFIQEGIYDEFMTKFPKQAKVITVGDPSDPSTLQGPQVDKVQYDKVLSYIEHGKRQGATLLTGGKTCGEKGFYIEPTIFADVT
nr:hypothetical protein [Tanacetum cinerariifolium]GFA10228.1 hypothetical protein [Tanacetum cinerariifolium]